MSGVRIIVTGNEDVARAMARLQDDANDLSDPMGAVGARVVSEAQGLARRRTGALAGSVHLERRRTSVSIVSGLVYSGVQNYGWRRHGIEASYFLNRAADEKGDLAADLIAAEITQAIRSNGLN
jgi:hypothetical protein